VHFVRLVGHVVAPGAIALVVASAPADSRADELETATLTYEARDVGARCPDAESFGRQVAARLGYPPFVAAGKHRVVVRLSGAGGKVHAHAEVTRAGSTTPGTRDLESEIDKCETLTQALATAVAIALDPVRGSGGPAAELPPLPPPPAEPPRTTPEPAPPPPPEAPAAIAPLAPARDPVVLFATAGVVGSDGLLPGVSLGGDVGFGLAISRFSLEASGRLEAMPTSARVDSGDEVTATVFSALLAPCVHLGGWALCALGRVGALQARAPNLAEPGLGTTIFGTLGAGVGYELPVSSIVALRALAAVEAPLVRTVLEIDQASVWIAPPVTAGLELGLVVSLTPAPRRP
jgi:hypothetical protein